MVKICSLHDYNNGDCEHNMSSYFEKYPYDLHIFQKWALEAIVTGNHVLITAPTGSGKTLPGEFAVDYFHRQKKKLIYTTPVKALSNQKFHDFRNKYPHISIGLITGDIKTNPDADILIMTTEILLNKLFITRSDMKDNNVFNSFEMDVEKELGCVVFDEIHMINDQARGHVWEQSILLLPEHIQMIGLSATLDSPEKFASWMENRGNQKNEISEKKIVYLTSKKDRAVPLTHYSFITVNSNIFKAIKDKTVQEEIRRNTNKTFELMTASGKFNELQYHQTNKMLKLFRNNKVFVKRQHVLNQVCKHLVEHEMMPAVCYVFSRKQLEVCAKEITVNLLETDSKIPYIMEQECQQIIRNLPNHCEYLHLKEYVNLVNLLKKGIAIHHAGMLPILREIVEILFAKGFVKLLFCTETIAIGLNLPVKTVIFTDINKFDGNGMRVLFSHEYTQSAGRAGRLGLDTVGHVIHLNNIFRDVTSLEYKQMMNGTPQKLTSKFKISFNLLLGLISIGDCNFAQFAQKSMVKNDIDQHLGEVLQEIKGVESKILDYQTNALPYLSVPENVLKEYIDLVEKEKKLTNKKKKEAQRTLETIRSSYKSIQDIVSWYSVYMNYITWLDSLNDKYRNIAKYIDNNVDVILQLLEKEDFLNSHDGYNLTVKGTLACQLREVHCLVFADLMEKNLLDNLSSTQLVSLFSCFTSISISENEKTHFVDTGDSLLDNVIHKVRKEYSKYEQLEDVHGINTGTEYLIILDLITYSKRWCECENSEECNLILREMENEKGIFLGEFVKSLLKINNIAGELCKICELNGNIALLDKLNTIPNITLKYVATAQSLYL